MLLCEHPAPRGWRGPAERDVQIRVHNLVDLARCILAEPTRPPEDTWLL
jgi:hypothetical protein